MSKDNIHEPGQLPPDDAQYVEDQMSEFDAQIDALFDALSDNCTAEDIEKMREKATAIISDYLSDPEVSDYHKTLVALHLLREIHSNKN